MKSANYRKQLLTGALALAFTLTTILALAGPGPQDGGRGIPGIAPPNSHAFGQTLTEWLSTYWRWYYTGADPAQRMVNDVLLMPLPAGAYVSGSGTPDDPALFRGELDLALAPGTPFVLPLFAWVWERYDPVLTGGQPDDIPMANSMALGGAHPTLTIDGRVVVSDANKAAFYVPVTPFDPIVTYPAPTSYGSVAALFVQGDGVVVLPLSPGRHVIHLYEPLIVPVGGYYQLPNGYGVIYDNTWVITVTAPGQK
jgi:hypothetical protein